MICTIYDISQATGYSIATISRVINNQGLVKPQTQEKILKAIDELGYEPSAMAQGLASNATHTIGLVLGEQTATRAQATYSLLLMNGVVSAAGDRGYSVLIERQNALAMSSVRRRHVDGMIFAGITSQFEAARKLLKQDIPFAYAGTQQPFDTLGCNIYGGFHLYKQEMLDILYRRGYRNVLLYEHWLASRDAILIRELEKSVAAFGKQDGSEPARCRLADYDYSDIEQFKESFRRLMEGPDRPDAICLDNSQLYVLVHEILQQLNLRVPDDLGIITTTHSKSEETNYSPPLTCIYLDAFEMGRRCAELLINQLEKNGEKIDRTVPYEFIERASLRPGP